MAKYSVPGIKFTEIDNSIRTESLPGMGIGAIVMKANKGPVNQRIVTRNYDEFTQVFGKPEAIDDNGHFAAENYFSNSTQLFAVRATMGDEQYAQIQFSYPDASVTATNESKDTCVMTYVDNQENNILTMLQPLVAYENIVSTGSVIKDWQLDEEGQKGFALNQEARYTQFNDIMSDTSDVVVFKSQTDDLSDVIEEEGKHVIYPDGVDVNGNVTHMDNKLILTTSAWENDMIPAEHISLAKRTGYNNGYEVTLDVPASATLNKKQIKIQFIGNYSAVSGFETSGVYYNNIFNNDNFYGNFSGDWDKTSIPSGYGVQDACKAVIIDWDDTSVPKTYYIDKTDITNVTGEEPKVSQAIGLEYREFGRADDNYAIVASKQLDDDPANELIYIKSVSAMYEDDTKSEAWGNDEYKERSPKQIVKQLIDEYGVADVVELNTYDYLRYYDIFTGAVVEKVIKHLEASETEYLKKHTNKYLFWYYIPKDETKSVIKSTFMANPPKLAPLPIQAGFVANDEEKTPLNSIVATPTSYIVNSVDKRYADGYTIFTTSEDDPGIGDIENYQSVFDNQLVITSIGPGEYGNDIGISIITTACADIAALNHQNAFNWKYAFDDEDQVDRDDDDLTWKKVFRINVYAKTKNQTAAGAWGSGMDAMLKDPVESWWVSTDPYAKDSSGRTLYAPAVINGNSDYIYVSRSSVNTALNARGVYEQPNQVFSIYQLTGGKNSSKNNIEEKTAALNFYKDRQRAKFDILFNCETIDTFMSRQRYAAHQKKIAQIAAARTMDIGVVQVTSKSAKTCKQMLSDAKMFSFNNGSYVAEYAGYDKYYNGDISSWVYLPKSVAGACAMALCDITTGPWYAPAGVQRGTINYTAGQLLRLSDDEIGQLYDNNINTSRDCGPYGVVLWGQKTALKKNSLLNRINIRRCLNYIEKQLENMMTPYLFMQNSVNTRSSARNDIDSFLQRVQAAQGIDRYALSVTQDEEDPTIMNVNIKVYPTSAIEFIDVKIYIDRNSGVAVTEG